MPKISYTVLPANVVLKPPAASAPVSFPPPTRAPLDGYIPPIPGPPLPDDPEVKPAPARADGHVISADTPQPPSGEMLPLTPAEQT
jgi:hypothetical protein